jgi:methanesulfonate monooxygenase subunit beta
MSTRAAVEEVIYRAALALDAGDFQGFLDLCEPDFRYVVGAHSPEIRKQMTWLDHDKAELQILFQTLPRHHSDHAALARHVTVYTVDLDAQARAASAVSALQVFRTALDGGATELFAVGKIHDIVRLLDGGGRLVQRRIQLDTRLLGIGTHIPF